MRKPADIFTYLESPEFSALNESIFKKIHAANQEQLIFEVFQN